MVGSGPASAGIRTAFDAWIDYGQEHAAYASAAFSRTSAFVPGCTESMGLALAEAQVAGACVVSTDRQVRADMLVPEASVHYVADDPGSLADALARAGERAGPRIRQSAIDKFDFGAVSQRTLRAIGLSAPRD